MEPKPRHAHIVNRPRGVEARQNIEELYDMLGADAARGSLSSCRRFSPLRRMERILFVMRNVTHVNKATQVGRNFDAL